MREYALYLESGPRRRKTMVHVLDLLGCVAQGPTTEEALQATPAAIRAYLEFLQRAGEPVQPGDDFTTVNAAHVMEGSWIGNGDPFPGFVPDFQPLQSEELQLYRVRLQLLQQDLLNLIQVIPSDQLDLEPEDGGRSLRHIYEHIAGSQAAYFQSPLGKPSGLAQAYRAIEQGALDLPSALAHFWQLTDARLADLSAEERTQSVPHGQVIWTARRGLRRMLEHEWEHLREISRRVK